MEIECCICFNKDWLTLTPCKHTLCLACVFKLNRDECPICRSKILTKLPLSIQKFLKINNSFNIFDNTDFPPLNDPL